MVGEKVPAGGQALEVAHEQANEPVGVAQVHLLLETLLRQPGLGHAANVQQMTAVKTHPADLHSSPRELVASGELPQVSYLR